MVDATPEEAMKTLRYQLDATESTYEARKTSRPLESKFS